MKQEDWEDGILRDIPSEKSSDEKTKFEAMGPIDIHEAINVHFQLDDLESLGEEFAPKEESK